MQLLALARTYVRNSKIMILDEPASNLDHDVEARLSHVIANHFKDVTRFVISHRYGSLREADRILVVDQGRIIENGSHDQLMQLNGFYAKGFREQAKKYQA